MWVCVCVCCVCVCVCVCACACVCAGPLLGSYVTTRVVPLVIWPRGIVCIVETVGRMLMESSGAGGGRVCVCVCVCRYVCVFA